MLKLTNKEIQFFKKNGYLKKEKFFNDLEIKALQKEVLNLKIKGHFKNVATDGDGKTYSNKFFNYQIVPLNDKSHLIRSLPFEKKNKKICF